VSSVLFGPLGVGRDARRSSSQYLSARSKVFVRFAARQVFCHAKTLRILSNFHRNFHPTRVSTSGPRDAKSFTQVKRPTPPSSLRASHEPVLRRLPLIAQHCDVGGKEKYDKHDPVCVNKPISSDQRKKQKRAFESQNCAHRFHYDSIAPHDHLGAFCDSLGGPAAYLIQEAA
jgi:hypothetical protein